MLDIPFFISVFGGGVLLCAYDYTLWIIKADRRKEVKITGIGINILIAGKTRRFCMILGGNI